MDRDDEIRMLAYRVWESEGRCDGRDLEHWLIAEAQWEVQQKKAKEPNATRLVIRPAAPVQAQNRPKKGRRG